VPDWKEEEAITETVFRDMNEWSEDMFVAGGVEKLIETYLCECSDRRCTVPIQLTRAEYEAVRGVPINFAIALDHENPEIDSVLAEHERYAVVQKMTGSAARIARDSDPRR
jgi:hypothetical protein